VSAPSGPSDQHPVHITSVALVPVRAAAAIGCVEWWLVGVVFLAHHKLILLKQWWEMRVRAFTLVLCRSWARGRSQ